MENDDQQALEVQATVHPIQAMERSQLETQIELAHKYPRDVAKCLDNAKSLIEMDQTTAREAFYSLDHYGGAPVVGPSIRMAEMLASSWGHITYGSRPLDIEDKVVRAQGVCYDFQTNTRVVVEKTRPIVDKRGVRFTKAHLINNAMLAAQAIAERDAILKVIPRAYANKLMDEAMEIASGKGLTMGEKVNAAIAAFADLDESITDKMLFLVLGVQDKRSMTIAHVTRLRTIYSTIREGHATIHDYLMQDPGEEDGAAKESKNKMTEAAKKAEEAKKAKKPPADKKKKPDQEPEPPAKDPEPEPEEKEEPPEPEVEPEPEQEPDEDGVVEEEAPDREALLIEWEEESAPLSKKARMQILEDVGSLDGVAANLDADQLAQAVSLAKGD